MTKETALIWYSDCWNTSGTLNEKKVLELMSWHNALLDRHSSLLYEVTGGRLSKCNYESDVEIEQAREYINREAARNLEDFIFDLKNLITVYE